MAPSRGRFQELYDAVNQLHERDRVLIHQVYWDGLSLRQLARKSGLEHRTIAVRHQRILRDLRQTLDGSILGERRVYSDGVYWIKCPKCHKWGESTRRCTCGAPDPALRTFDFAAYSVSDTPTPPKILRTLEERRSRQLEREADDILRNGRSA